MSNANSRQVAGEHYKSAYQHWDLVHDMDLGYFEGQITKYTTRRRHKNGKEDVDKAIHFATKLKELVDKNHRTCRRGNPNITLIEEYVRSNQLTTHEAAVIRGVCSWVSAPDLAQIIGTLQFISKSYENGI